MKPAETTDNISEPELTAGEQGPGPTVRLPRPAFPVCSALAALGSAMVLLVRADPSLGTFYQVPPDWLQLLLRPEALYALACLLLLALLADTRRHVRRQRALQMALNQLQDENRTLWQQRHELRLRAQTYSGHADRLKRFISDKLLDYIEYDEKFLHFQSIAAEVRHNGVIAFDRVQIALQKAMDQADRDTADYREASVQMRYLWDLLDLATTDNLALYIGNLQAQCEERYYQKLLNPEDPEPTPLTIDYSPRLAVWQAVRPLLHEQTLTDALRQQLDTPEQPLLVEQDPLLALRLLPTGPLLGKANHLTLLLDNLLKNAQFYAHKRAYRHRHNRIRLNMDETDGLIRLRVYNRGPHIPATEQDRIFHLGYSTRRVQEHHGKGLGLFFVQEIVRGYDGRILIHNEDNARPEPTADSLAWHFRFRLSNGDLVHETAQVVLVDGQPRVRMPEPAEPERQCAWSLRKAVTAVEVSCAHSGEQVELTVPTAEGTQALYDPFRPELPHWVLEFHPRKRGCRVVFEPLDVRGVTFEVLLPTAESRLEGSQSDLADIDDEVERLNEPFAAAQPEGYR
ncbi:GHKL domain-containing protein [Natronospirillum operosum]|uniref:histidine kinase n=1 Tax=Natronospirillum operosum TaxID=2759953 RepID=A0A4Z0WEV2_9GAMM|nr:ATP-binding protein [Natronospirillum operosum]TGG93972.1 GHKL domain-containing protein [Natronospirillum operosum]